MIKKYTSLLFDIDNTLLDFFAAEKSAVSYVLKAEGLPFDDETVSLYSAINQSYWERFERGEIPKSDIFEGRFKTLLSEIKREGDPAKISKDYCARLSCEHQKVDGADEILICLKERGYKLYAATNGLSSTQYRRIEESGLKKYFDGIFVSEDAGHQKPEKEYYDYVISKIEEKDRRKMLIIGDSMSSDILGGKNAEIDTCWFNFAGTKKLYEPDYQINSLEELKNIL